MADIFYDRNGTYGGNDGVAIIAIPEQLDTDITEMSDDDRVDALDNFIESCPEFAPIDDIDRETRNMLTKLGVTQLTDDDVEALTGHIAGFVRTKLHVDY